MASRKRFGTAAVAIALGTILGASLIAPAVAHVNSSVKHLYKHLDKRYTRNAGLIAVPVFDGWSSGDPENVTATYHGNFTSFTSGNNTLNAVNLALTPTIPSVLYGKRLAVTGVEVCYNVADPVYIEAVALYANSSTEPTSSGGNLVIDDTTDRTQAECRRFTGTPQALPRNGWVTVEVRVRFPFGAPSSMWIQRTTFLLRPTKQSP